MRPVIADVVTALAYLASQKYESDAEKVQSPCLDPGTPTRMKRDKERKLNGGRGSERERTRKLK